MVGRKEQGMDRLIATDFLLIRIVALLFSLAGIAERAASGPAPLRHTLLWLLIRAEPAARRVVVKVAFDLGWQVDIPRFQLYGDDPDEAIALAERFYQLASMLQQLLGFAARAASMIAWPAGWQGFGRRRSHACKQHSFRPRPALTPTDSYLFSARAKSQPPCSSAEKR
jgi:hypothetical protein